MNSEELELSLRSEFENYLKSVRAELKEEAEQLHKKFEAEIDNHRAQLAEAFKAYSDRFDSEEVFDEGFKSSVMEHLRLARDEGSKLAATAMAEAEAMEQEKAAVAPADYTSLRDAVMDISKQDSQSTILKSLIEHAAGYAPRGAFFIIKNEHLVGWKVFGEGVEDAESAIRDVRFPVSSDTLLAKAVRSLETTEGAFGAHSDDTEFLDPIHFGHPDRMCAIPLVARGRGVAVIYIDHGAGGGDVNTEALETLVQIAGLTVELLAASHTAAVENRQTAPANFEDTQQEQRDEVPAERSYFDEPAAETAFEEPADPEAVPAYESFEEASLTRAHETSSYEEIVEGPAPEFHEEPEQEAAAETQPEPEPEQEPAFGAEPAVDHSYGETADHGAARFEPADEPVSDFGFGAPPEFQAPAADEPFAAYAHHERPDLDSTQPAFGETQAHEDTQPAPVAEYQPEPVPEFASHTTETVTAFDTGRAQFEPAVAEFEPAVAVSTKPEAAIEVSPSNTGFARLSDRPVDLPIQVPDDERRLHNDARRFARLLVSEIKLYNEKKVQEGRQSRDLYERLREAIDRSREMYDKRVQPPVAAKFDYFHYELVNALADGEAERLGSGYPGSHI